eukprot:7169110-Prorocentrum_lima.AAC.1
MIASHVKKRSFPDEHPDSLMMKMHGHDTTGDMQWNRVNAVKNKQKYWMEPSCLAADPELLS